MNMEELTGILFVVAAIVLKVIEAKFKKAGKTTQPKVQTHEVFTSEVDEQKADELPKWVREIVQPESVLPVEEKPAIKAEPAQPATITFEQARKPMKKALLRPSGKPILQEEKKKTREKIDPKKLIVYSEIMNRKY